MYQSPEGGIWDIDVLDKDASWGSQFDNIDEPDEDNLLLEVEWLPLRTEEVEAFVSQWDGDFCRAIVDQVKAKISAAGQLAATP